MKRREFVKGIGVAGGLAALPWQGLLADAAHRTLSAEWNVRSPQEVIDGHRLLLHLLAASTDLYLEADGSYRIAVAHRDPGVPNWLSTEGKPFGTIFWRFQLPKGAPERPRTQVMPLADVAKG